MNIDDIREQHINVETLPDELHMQLTVQKLANELINMTLLLETAATYDDIEQTRIMITKVRMHMIKLVATMIHLFEWIDFGDIVDKNNFRRFLEEYVVVSEMLENSELEDEMLKKISVYGKLEER